MSDSFIMRMKRDAARRRSVQSLCEGPGLRSRALPARRNNRDLNEAKKDPDFVRYYTKSQQVLPAITLSRGQHDGDGLTCPSHGHPRTRGLRPCSEQTLCSRTRLTVTTSPAPRAPGKRWRRSHRPRRR